MYLKRLEIVGFKSFTERTAVSFGPGISAVVGPNGCGKSNIIDAIRWVMGEQSPKLLRARNMEDLLFNGSQNRPPAGVAEVTLTLARDDDPARGQAEVSVTRRLYRGGESEYLINRTSGRLKDVIRFFIEAGMGTRNYSIIEQEKVGRLVDAPPEERRLLIDEAAGVTRYKEQKRESERRLDSAGQNLVTVSAMLSETSKRLSVVSRAASKAAKWKSIREELKTLELALSARRFLTITSKLASLSAQAAEKRGELASREVAAAEAELRIDEARVVETGAVQALEEAMGDWHQKQTELANLAKELDHNERERLHAEENLKRASEELESLSGQGADQEAERLELAERAQVLEEELKEANAEKESLKDALKMAETNASEASAEKRSLDSSLADARDRLQRQIESKAGEEGRIKILAENLKKYQLESNQSDQLIAEAERALSSRERHKASLQEDLDAAVKSQEGLRSSSKEARSALEVAMRELGAAEREAAALASRYDTLENLKDGGFGWYPEGVKALLKDPEAKGLISPVAEALKVPDGFEEAAEAFLGERLGWIVAENRESALEALRRAREKGLGRCGLVSKADAPEGDILGALLGKLELADDLPDSIPAKASKAILTRQGDYLGPLMMAGGGESAHKEDRGKGDFNKADKGKTQPGQYQQGKAPQAKGASGGKNGSPKSAQADGLLARLKELEALGEELKKTNEAKSAVEAKVEIKRSELAEADKALAEADEKRAALSTDLSEANSKIMVAKSEAKGLTIRRDALTSEMARAQAQMDASERQLASASEEQAKLSAKLSDAEARHQKAAADHETKAKELEEVRQKSGAAASRADKAAELLEGVNRELARLDAWRKNLDNRRKSLRSQADSSERNLEILAEKKKEAEAKMEGLPEIVSEAERKVTELRSTLTESRASVTAKEEEARSARKARGETADSLSELDAELMEAKYGLTRLKADLLKDWRVVLAGPKDEEEPEESEREKVAREGIAQGDNAPGEIGQEKIEDDEIEEEELGEEEVGEEEVGEEGIATEEGALAQSGPAEEMPSGAALVGTTRASEIESDSEGAEAKSDAASDAKAEETAQTSAETWDAAVQAPPDRLDPFDLADMELPDDAEATIGRLRERLASMGEINHTALEEEAELKTKLSFHQTQFDDLTGAIKDLKDSIERVNQTCQKRFADTFAQADIKFREIFPVLFEGGEGWLSLTDEKDPLESGVEIHVHPPGKKIMVMRSLSGGEKTLTSLCLIFALYLIKPSPYCLLDEADAPLDEANIDRFNRLLRNLSEASQIIMVTHNKRTMQISDTLYGVTMETPGVSRLVSVNLSEAEVLTNA